MVVADSKRNAEDMKERGRTNFNITREVKRHFGLRALAGEDIGSLAKEAGVSKVTLKSWLKRAIEAKAIGEE